MKCPKCQFENPEDSQFCLECGGKFESRCPKCSKVVPIGAKFCNGCGHDLTIPTEPTPKDLSFEEKIDKIQRYLPKGLTEKILAQRGKIEGERKQVTVMFCDMEGFTPLVERLGSEEAYSIMDQVYEILIHKVHDYEGTVNEMTGDGIMALFGAPVALEDAPQRAIRSAIAIHLEMTRFSERIKQEGTGMPTIKMRIGIHTGPVVVGTVGNNLRVEFKAVGDTVNLASRVEGLADPGTTFTTEDTFKLTEGLFRFEALGKKEIKGKEDPVNVYRVIAPSTRRTRFDVSAETGLTPFVGRTRELELLLDGFERAKQGRGQAFSIIAEAGVGKSRLLYEFRKAVASEDATFLEGKCLSYSRNVTYHPVIDILKSNFDVNEGDSDSRIKAKLKKGLQMIGADEASNLPYLLELLSVEESGIDQIPMSPEVRKDRMIETMIRISLKGSEISPLIMAVEDLHWIDNSSEDVLKYLLESISGARILLIFTYRPEFVHTWAGRSYHNQVNLNRLSNRESLSMVSHLLGTEDIDRDLENLILEKTEGIPFFIEEFLKSLNDLKMIERKGSKYHLTKNIRDLAIPSTIHDVIMARVDSLPERAKEVLQTGSVIEREFGYALIKKVTGLSEKELLSNLSVLKDSELLFERGVFPESTHIFKHALTREVVYESILTKRKKKLHKEIGEAIEELYSDSIDEHYAVLAEHFIEGEGYEKGADYSKRAGRKARKDFALREAISYANKAVFCIERLPRTDAVQKKIIDARTNLANYCMNLNYYVEAKDAVDPIADLALELNYKKSLPAIYNAIGTNFFYVGEDFNEGLRYLNNAVKISTEIGDFFSLWTACYQSGTFLSWNCEFEKGLESFKKSLDMAVAANNPIGISFVKSTICTFVYIPCGKLDLAFQESNDSLRMAQESGDIRTMGVAHAAYGYCCYCKGLSNEAENSLLRAESSFEKTTDFFWGAWASYLLGDVYFDRGKYEIVMTCYDKAISYLELSKSMPSYINLSKIAKARVDILNKTQHIDINELHRLYNTNNIKTTEGWMARLISEILLNVDDQHISEAEEWINKAIKAHNRNGIRWHLATDYAVYGDLLKRKGDQSGAKENLSKAIEIFKECGADGWVEKYEKELAALL